MVDYSKYVRELGFEVVENLASNVFKASKNGFLVTIKLAIGSSVYANHVRKENRALDRAKGIDGIIEKISFHELDCGIDGKLVAIVRRYIDGKVLLYYKGKLNKGVLRSTVKALHKKGIVWLDSYVRNIVVDSIGKPYLIDLGLCNFKEELTKEAFMDIKQYDLMDLECTLEMYPGVD